MQIKITLTPTAPLHLPLSYHHLLQGMIYHLLSKNSSYSNFLHNMGYSNGKHPYKLFCFGLLEGSYRICQRNIIFDNTIILEIRSPMDDFNEILYHSFLNTDFITLYNQTIPVTNIVATAHTVTKSSIKIKMKSPLCVSKTIYENDKKITLYSTPLDSDFSTLIQQNFLRKYTAASATHDMEKIQLQPISIGTKDKYVTKFKNSIYITGWKGIYQLEGSPESLTFLYNVGLGARNSQGFGMFDIIS
ncbi:MAG: CRISPR-associated endoribonuclease Cas6 [Eubacteriales bacterium]